MKIELKFIGSDYSPLVNGDGLNNFVFDYLIDGDKKNRLYGDEKRSPKKDLLYLLNSESEQRNLLIDFMNDIQSDINDKNRDIFTEFTESDDEKQLFTYFNGKPYFGGLVGIVSKDGFSYPKNSEHQYKITLQINSRFDIEKKKSNDSSNSPNKINQKPYFLITMLLNGASAFFGSEVNRDDEISLSDLLLLYLFFRKFQQAYIKGYFKTYHSFERNDDKIKGPINFPKHIRLNIGKHNGKASYSFKEKDEYNYLNHLIIAAYECLKRKFSTAAFSLFNKNIQVKNALEYLKCKISYPYYSKKTLLFKNEKKLSHPFYTEYEELRRVCFKIIKGDKISIFNGCSDEQVDGVLMYIPRLWERFLESFMKQTRPDLEAQKEVFIIDSTDGNFINLTKPDFVFNNDEKPHIILDAKFKPEWFDAAVSGRIKTSLANDYNKCMRDMVSIKAHYAGVIFPTNQLIDNEKDYFIYEGNEYPYLHAVSEYNQKDKFYMFPINIPPIEGEYEKWLDSFNNYCKEAIEIVCNHTIN